jgi:threonine-phosphate decarboxylase
MSGFLPDHGGQLREIAGHFGIPVSQLLDFSSNINPEGPPATVLTCLRASLEDTSTLTHYPDLGEADLRHSLARYACVAPENVAVANGFVPLLDAALRILPIRKCLLPVPAFVEYRKTLQRALVETVASPLTESSGFSYDAEKLLNGSHHAVLLANPQNPSGVLSKREALVQFVDRAATRNIYVLLDEAFIDYCPEASLTREMDRFPNLVVFRSVTKFFGIPGLRVAYAVANAKLCTQLQETIAPWSITTLASLAAVAAVQDEAYRSRTIALNKARRDQMRAAVSKLGIHVYKSEANFLLLRLPDLFDRRQLWERLIVKHHLILRNCANYEGLGNRHLRAAVRTETENQRLIKALAYEVKSEQRQIVMASQSAWR